MTHIWVGNRTIIGSDNGLSLCRRQAIIWSNAGILLIGSLGTNFGDILIEILTFSFKKKRLKVSVAELQPFCLGLNVLTLTTAVKKTLNIGQGWVYTPYKTAAVIIYPCHNLYCWSSPICSKLIPMANVSSLYITHTRYAPGWRPFVSCSIWCEFFHRSCKYTFSSFLNFEYDFSMMVNNRQLLTTCAEILPDLPTCCR